jgi:hypothetical protein
MIGQKRLRELQSPNSQLVFPTTSAAAICAVPSWKSKKEIEIRGYVLSHLFLSVNGRQSSAISCIIDLILCLFWQHITSFLHIGKPLLAMKFLFKSRK